MRAAVALVGLLAIGCGAERPPASPDAAPPAHDAMPMPPDAGCSATPITQNIDVGGMTLQVVTQGCGPRLVLLHGFPEFSFTWDPLMPLLAGDHTVITPNMRGYAPSEIPTDLSQYEVSHMVADVGGLLDALGGPPPILIAHDWGGLVAWVFAAQHPDKIKALVIINAPQPDVFARELAMNPSQRMASSYINFFLTPTAEDTLAQNNYQALINAFQGTLSAAQQAQYRAAWAQPGTLTGMLNYYRANFVNGPSFAPTFPMNDVVTVPTLVAWGTADTALLSGNLTGLDAYVPHLTLHQFPMSGHWIIYQEPAALVQIFREWESTL